MLKILINKRAYDIVQANANSPFAGGAEKFDRDYYMVELDNDVVSHIQKFVMPNYGDLYERADAFSDALVGCISGMNGNA